MSATSIVRVVVPSLALVAASGAAIFFGMTQLRPEPPPETATATAVPLVSPPAPAANDTNSTALAKVQAEANDVASQLAVSPPPPPAADASAPVFDVARIEATGDAVIAGRAAPGATVELLRDGEHHDQAVADQSGQFVIVPPRLPAGNYQLTLRSRSPDGTLATSKQSVAVALNEVPSSTGALQSHAEVPPNVPATAVANRSPEEAVASEPPHATAAAPPSGGSAKIATAVVSRGDTLWRISRLTYGVGERYAIVYRANRERIRDPNRIYPGQIFVLPMKTR